MKGIALLAASIAMSIATAAAAQTGQARLASNIASDYVSLAGSPENALALVQALRHGERAQLTYDVSGTGLLPSVHVLDPPTSRMSWADVKVALVLVKRGLARAGVTQPTGEELVAALYGVLRMRADGMGWARIAQTIPGHAGPAARGAALHTRRKGPGG